VAKEVELPCWYQWCQRLDLRKHLKPAIGQYSDRPFFDQEVSRRTSWITNCTTPSWSSFSAAWITASVPAFEIMVGNNSFHWFCTGKSESNFQ
jgi:hypothetical protein